jgi:hypothetical protein
MSAPTHADRNGDRRFPANTVGLVGLKPTEPETRPPAVRVALTENAERELNALLRANDLENIATQILILHQIPEVIVHVLRINSH